ncbi:MAG: M48 family metallopeptidase [Vulcanimicrobiaceae bacterium]
MRRYFIALGTGLGVGYAAVRALESLRELLQPGPSAQKDAAAYGRSRRRFMLVGILRSTAITAAFAYGAAERMARMIPLKSAPQRTMLFTSAGLLLGSVLELPIEFIEDFTMERRYAMSAQTPRAWLVEQAKATLISMALVAPLGALFGLLVKKKPLSWPWFASAALCPLFILGNLIVPTFIAPLFNRFEPLRGPLEERLRALGRRYGVGSAQILRVDMSRQTKKANAYVTGVFNTHRIVVGDTLIENFPNEEIEFVVAHELGHYVAKDTWRLIALGQLTASAMLLAADRAMSYSRDDLWEPHKLARLYFWMVIFSQLLRPGLFWFTRSREWAADRFATVATNAPQVGARAFERLREVNLAEDEQPRWMEVLFSTHPSLKARIAALNAASS